MSLGMGFEIKNPLATSSFSLSLVFEGKDVRSQHPVAMAVPAIYCLLAVMDSPSGAISPKKL